MSDDAVTIRFADDCREFKPGETLRATCELAGRSAEDVSSVDWSVYWRTEGKGDEDSDDHADDRESSGRSLAERRENRLSFECRLPPSPLSYDGIIVKIRWFVAATVTIAGGGELEGEAEFRLGHVAPAQEVSK